MTTYIDTAVFVKAFILEADSAEAIASYDSRQRNAAEFCGLELIPSSVAR
jgi:hypothetical protein